MAANKKKAYLVAVMAVVVVVMVAVAKAQSPSQCDKEKGQLVQACSAVVLLGQNPSPSCCKLVRAARVQCICPSVTPKVASYINVRSLDQKIKGCRRTIPRKFKCGSITFPP